MSVFLIWRAVFCVLLVLLNGTICASAGLNISTTTGPGSLRSLDGYLIFLSSASILFLFPVLLLDILGRKAVTSKVWVECIWLGVLCLLNLAGTSATMILSPRAACAAGDLGCLSNQVLVAFTSFTTALLLVQFLLLFSSSVYYCPRHAKVWSAYVRDFQWYKGGGVGKSTTLGSGPPSPHLPARAIRANNPNNPVPHLERMVAQWQSGVANPAQAPEMRTVHPEPQPLTLAYAPELPPTRAPTHYTAAATFAVGVLPGGRQPSLKKKNQLAPLSFYPTSVQTAIRNTDNGSSPPPIPRQSYPGRSALGLEPPPIQNWPRANPPEPVRPKKRTTAPAPEPYTTLHDRSSEAGPSRPTRAPPSRPSGPRHRPPPLDLSAASPTPRVR